MQTPRLRATRRAVIAGALTLLLAAAVVPAGAVPALAAAGAGAALPSGCSPAGSTVTCTFAAPGTGQSFTVPAGVSSLSAALYGATGSGNPTGDAAGGDGAEVTAQLAVSPGQQLGVDVGGAGQVPQTALSGGGVNGGGQSTDGGGGGGATDITVLGPGTPVLVAGGGGGGGGDGSQADSCLPGSGQKLVAGAGGNAGNPGQPGQSYSGGGISLPGGAGGAAGTTSGPGKGGAGGAGSGSYTGTPACPNVDGQVGVGIFGGDGSGSRGGPAGSQGTGGPGGGGGGGGYFGGGAGGGGAPEDNNLGGRVNAGAAGGGGGASYTGGAGVTGATVTDTGNPGTVNGGNGEVIISYTPPASATTTATTLSSSPSPSQAGQQVTYTATIAPAPDGGTVAFTDGGAAIAGCGAQLVDTGTGAATCQVTYPSAGSHTVTAAYSGDAAFAASTSAPLTHTVGQAAQSISFTAPSSGTVSGSATLTATGGGSGNPVVFSVDASSGAGVCSVTGTNGTTVNYAGAGSCVIDANQAGNADYLAAAQVTGTITVSPALQPQSISFTAPATGTVGGSATLSATGGGSGSPVVFSVDASSGAGVCTVTGTNGTTVNYAGAGSCVIDANQAGNASYAAAPQVTQTITVNPLQAQSISFTAPATGYVGESATLTATGGGSGNPVVFSVDSSSGSGVCTVSGDTVSYTAAGSCVIDANQAGNTSYAPAPQVSQTITVGAGLVITTSILNPAFVFVGQAYGTTLAAAGGVGPYTWSLAAGSSLPPGLTLYPNGQITGTPTLGGQYSFTAAVTDSESPPVTVTAQFTLFVILNVTTGPNLPGGYTGTPYSQQLSAAGGVAPYSWQVTGGSLPPGLTLSPSGLVSGTPTATGTYSFTANVTDSQNPAAFGNGDFTITVGAGLVITTSILNPAFVFVGQAYGTTLAAAGGVGPYTWSLAAGSSLPPGLTLYPNGQITGTPTLGGQYSFTAAVTDSESPPVTVTAQFTLFVILNVTTGPNLPGGYTGTPYSQQLSAAGGVAPYSWQVTGGSLPPGLTLSPSGLVSGTPTATGTYSFTANVTDSQNPAAFGNGDFTITVGAGLVITTSILNPAFVFVGQAYGTTLAAAGGVGPYTWSLAAGSSLPPGLTLYPNGQITGTPTLGGQYSFTAAVTDSESPPVTVTAQFTLFVILNVTTGPNLPGGYTGTPYSQQLSAAGGVAPYSWQVTGGSLPPGLTLSPSGLVSGTPTATGTYSFTANVTDSQNPAAFGNGDFTITVGAGSQSISFTAPATGTVGGSATLTATGGGSGNPVIFSVDASSGAGVCTVSGTNGATVTYAGAGSCVIDANQAGNANYLAAPQVQQTITVGKASQSISFTAPATGTVGASATLTATGGGSGNPVVFSVDASSGAGVCTVSGTNGSTVSYTAAGSCVIDASQAGNANYLAAPQLTQTITVNQAPAFVIDSPPLTAVAGQTYDYTFTASGTPASAYALAAGAPSWLSVNPRTGEVTGTPPSGTTSFSYAVTATNVAGTATAGPFSVTVAKASSNADISAVLTCPASLTVGGTGTCALTVANAGPATATKVVAGIVLPSALSETSCTSGCARHANVFTWTLASLASGASAKFTITVKASRTGTATVLAAAVSANPDPHPLNNISLQQITITR